MRAKSELQQRDLYARKYAALLSVEALIDFWGKKNELVTVVEAEDDEDWDDIVQLSKKSGFECRHQVKRQLTALSSEIFSSYIISASKGAETRTYVFCFPSYIQVDNIGEIRVLKAICQRSQQSGAVTRKIIDNLRDAERIWIDYIKKCTKFSDEDTLKLLRRIDFRTIGLEDDIDNFSLRLLVPMYRDQAEAAWKTICEYILTKDGVVEILPSKLLDIMPPLAFDKLDTFYWSLIEDVEKLFLIGHWGWLTDNLVRILMPLEFYENCLKFSRVIAGVVWPKRYSKLESCIIDLANRSYAYVEHFEAGAQFEGEWLRPDYSYKKVYPNPRYDEESEKSQKWADEANKYLVDVTFSLNQLFQAVRENLDPTFRLREGKLGIHDSLGVTNQMTGIIIYPTNYAHI